MIKNAETNTNKTLAFLWFSGRHPYPFNDQVVVYIRQLGPGVLVGQAWQEGKALDQVPRKLFEEILMVKDYAGFSEKQ